MGEGGAGEATGTRVCSSVVAGQHILKRDTRRGALIVLCRDLEFTKEGVNGLIASGIRLCDYIIRDSVRTAVRPSADIAIVVADCAGERGGFTAAVKAIVASGIRIGNISP